MNSSHAITFNIGLIALGKIWTLLSLSDEFNGNITVLKHMSVHTNMNMKENQCYNVFGFDKPSLGLWKDIIKCC